MWRLIFKRHPLVAAGVLCGVHRAVAASAQLFPIKPENRAKLARLKIQGGVASRSASADKKESSGDDDDECSIEIGNIDTGGRGLLRVPREVNIFIPEPIFQVNNRCRASSSDPTLKTCQ